jgi:hypothetical protein
VEALADVRKKFGRFEIATNCPGHGQCRAHPPGDLAHVGSFEKARTFAEDLRREDCLESIVVVKGG